MSIDIRRDADIYDTEGGWFRARWHFSFDQYRDPENDSFGAMRVFNDDRLVPGAVWPLHPHRDVEGLTYVVEGTFGHEDNVGGPFGPLPAGSVQRMTLGSGALHSELQRLDENEPMRFIQIWILPDTPSLPPGVEQRVFTTRGPDEPAAEGDRARRAATSSRSTRTRRSTSPGSRPASRSPTRSATGRGVYAYLIDGSARFDGEAVATGDAAKVTDQPVADDHAPTQPCELILVDVPMQFEAVGIWAGRD